MNIILQFIENFTKLDWFILTILLVLQCFKWFGWIFFLLKSRKHYLATIPHSPLYLFGAPFGMKLVERALALSVELSSIALDIFLYSAIRFLIKPEYPTWGIVLIISLVIRRLALALGRIAYPHFMRLGAYPDASNTQKKKSINYFILQQTANMISASGFVLIVALSISGAIRLSDSFHFQTHLDQNLLNTELSLSKLTGDTTSLQTTLDSLIEQFANTRNSTANLLESLTEVEQTLTGLRIERKKLEKRILEMQQMSEEDIRNQAIYNVLAKLLSSGSGKNLTIGFFIGVIASLIANYISARRFGVGMINVLSKRKVKENNNAQIPKKG